MGISLDTSSGEILPKRMNRLTIAAYPNWVPLSDTLEMNICKEESRKNLDSSAYIQYQEVMHKSTGQECLERIQRNYLLDNFDMFHWSSSSFYAAGPLQF